MSIKHPARFTNVILDRAAPWLTTAMRYVDPFCGTGKIARLKERGVHGLVYGVEIEPEWQQMAVEAGVRCILGDARFTPFPTGFFDAAFTSPTYGNRLADKHKRVNDKWDRRSYTFDLGRDLHPSNSGRMKFNDEYRDFHLAAWTEMRRYLRPGGLALINVSNHVAKHSVVHVVEWHIECLTELGFELIENERIETPRLRYGANSENRVDHENLLILRR